MRGVPLSAQVTFMVALGLAQVSDPATLVGAATEAVAKVVVGTGAGSENEAWAGTVARSATTNIATVRAAVRRLRRMPVTTPPLPSRGCPARPVARCPGAARRRAVPA